MKFRRHSNNKGRQMLKSGSRFRDMLRRLPKKLRKLVKTKGDGL